MKTLFIYAIAIMCWLTWKFFINLTKIKCIMKKLLIIIFLAISSTMANSQTINATFSPEKLGYGFIYEQHVFGDFSILASYDRGMYKRESERCRCISKVGIQKYGAGMRYRWAMLLVQYNDIYKEYNPGHTFNTSKINKVSIELGGMVELGDRLQSGIVYDILNYEARLTLGYKIWQ